LTAAILFSLANVLTIPLITLTTSALVYHNRIYHPGVRISFPASSGLELTGEHTAALGMGTNTMGELWAVGVLFFPLFFFISRFSFFSRPLLFISCVCVFLLSSHVQTLTQAWPSRPETHTGQRGTTE
jgi:hypothetical protein